MAHYKGYDLYDKSNMVDICGNSTVNMRNWCFIYP